MTRQSSICSVLAAFGLFAGLSGCLFDRENGTFTYTTEFYGVASTVHEYNADGSVNGVIGFGIEDVDDLGLHGEDGMLKLWPLSIWRESDTSDFLTHFSDSLLSADMRIDPDGDGWPSQPFLALTRDSSFLLRLDPGILLPQLIVVRADAGLSCRFSDPRAFQIQDGSADTIRLKTNGLRLSRTAEGVRFAVLIHTAASEAGDSRADFDHPVVAQVDVTCPDP